jgi:hypothetical protein
MSEAELAKVREVNRLRYCGTVGKLSLPAGTNVHEPTASAVSRPEMI